MAWAGWLEMAELERMVVLFSDQLIGQHETRSAGWSNPILECFCKSNGDEVVTATLQYKQYDRW